MLFVPVMFGLLPPQLQMEKRSKLMNRHLVEKIHFMDGVPNSTERKIVTPIPSTRILFRKAWNVVEAEAKPHCSAANVAERVSKLSSWVVNEVKNSHPKRHAA